MRDSADPISGDTSDDLTDDDLRQMLTDMIGARVCSNRAFNLQRQGRAGTNAPVDGSEAIVVGAAMALDPHVDWVLPQYREQVALTRFGPAVLERYVQYILGHPEGGHLPVGTNVWPPQISLATQAPHGVGMAWGLQLQGIASCVVVFIGDGSTSEGDFYEAANFAGVLKVPVVFVVVNNGWAISTPLKAQTNAKNLAEKAHAFGFPGVTVDGGDPVAVYDAMAEARSRALSGAGPTLIEAVTHRLAPHTTADDPTRYIPAEQFEAALQRDPIVRFERELMDRGIWTEADRATAEAEADERMDRAVRAGEAAPADTISVFDHVYATMPDRLKRQRDEFIDVYRAGDVR